MKQAVLDYRPDLVALAMVNRSKVMPELTDNKNPLQKFNRFFLYIMVPLLGIIIPNITSIIINGQYTFGSLLLSYMWFIFISYAVWQGNILLLKRIRKHAEKNAPGYYRVILSYFLSNIVYTACISVLFLRIWFALFNPNNFSWSPVLYTSTVIIFCVVLINAVYEIIFLRQEMEDSFLKVKLLEMDKIQAELTALKSQIDPHFIFNSLNTLSYLINSKPSIAKIYNDTLAKVYRYILVYKDENLVFLKEELEFVSNYFFLINIRYEEAVNLIIEIPDVKAENYLVTPVSLQILIENAIKHNDFSKKEPLVIHLGVQSSFVIVKKQDQA